MYKPYNKNLYKILRLLLISFVICLVEGLILKAINYDHRNPFWMWGTWLVLGVSITMFLNSIANLIEIYFSFSTKAIRLIINFMFIMGLFFASLGLLK